MYTAEEWELVWMCFKFMFMFYMDMAIALTIVIFFIGLDIKLDKTQQGKNNYVSLRNILYLSLKGGLLWPLTLQELHKFNIKKK